MEITVFGGAGEIGGNQIRLRSGGEERWLDLGLPYSRYGQYFEEYLQPRTAPILADLLRTRLIPPVEIYRYDLRSLATQRLGQLDLAPSAEATRVYLSHPHLDHAGLLGLLRPDIEVCLSAEAAAVLRSLQETNGSFPTADLLWVGDRDEGGQKKKGAATPRSLLVAGEAQPLLGFHNAVRSFLAGRKSKVELPALDLRPALDEAFIVDHSIPGAIGWVLQLEGDLVVYPGDVRSHGRRRGAMLQALEQLRARAQGRLLLVLEGTRFGEAAHEESEESVQQALTEVVRRAEGRLAILDFHARNVERLLTAYQVAAATGRRLVITHKDAHLLLSLKDVATPYEGCAAIETVCRQALIYRKARVSSSRRLWEALVEEHFQVVDFSVVRQRPESYLLCFSFFDITELIDVVDGGGGGIYVYSSSEAFNEEMKLDLARLRNWLALLGLEFIGDPDAPSPQYGRLHVSGHGGSEELAALATALRPDTVLVVHTEKPQEYAAFLRERLAGAQVLVPARAETIAL